MTSTPMVDPNGSSSNGIGTGTAGTTAGTHLRPDAAANRSSQTSQASTLNSSTTATQQHRLLPLAHSAAYRLLLQLAAPPPVSSQCRVGQLQGQSGRRPRPQEPLAVHLQHPSHAGVL
ncbi:unnamed protein product [Alternaria alternata]